VETSVAKILDFYAEKFNSIDFIEDDPISIPHRYSLLQDIEISGFWTAMLSWGQRKTIINKASELMRLMENSPYDFILNHTDKDRKAFLDFKHRTFNSTDTLYFLDFFQRFYKEHNSLEEIFASKIDSGDLDVRLALSVFHNYFFNVPYAPKRTRKHVATPDRKSRCKRINMFLRWMVRKDDKGVDFGLWNQISPSQLLIPLDVHVERVARSMGLLERKQNDFKAVLELTETLRQFNPKDPVKYDFALFGLGLLESKKL
jgi:uncharacterized protein (TIGR02757 family)